MYGDTANKLIISAKRAETLDKIGFYETDLVQTIINESIELQTTIDNDASSEKDYLADLEASRISSTKTTPHKSSNSINNSRAFLSSSVSSTPGGTHSNHGTEETQKIISHLPEYLRRLCIARNKRCLLAYEMSRIKKLDSLVWDNVEFTSDQLADLSHHEKIYLDKYESLVSGVKGVMSEIDLGGDLEPPSDVFIDVRVLKDAGEIMTEYGVFNLTKDSQFFVRKSDVERLIQQGYLKQL